MFIDTATIFIKAGKGGDGAVAFHREKFVAAGGPDGGDGGKGGDVVFVADPNLSTLMDFRYKRKYAAQPGENGRGGNCSGKNAQDLVIRVPRGTVIRDADSGSVVKDTVRRITRAEMLGEGPEYALFIEGTGFLYNMVRIIAGTLIGVGTGKLEPGAFSRALISKSRLDLGVTAPAHGLTLMEVFYQ